VEAEVDGQPVFANTLKRGEYETFKGAERIVLFLARADAVRMTANGDILARPSAGAYRGVFTPKTNKLPENVAGATSVEPAAETTVSVETPDDASDERSADTAR
jgi:hypothetical protein